MWWALPTLATPTPLASRPDCEAVAPPAPLAYGGLWQSGLEEIVMYSPLGRPNRPGPLAAALCPTAATLDSGLVAVLAAFAEGIVGRWWARGVWGVCTRCVHKGI